MDFSEIWMLAPKLMPLAPRIEKAITTVQRLRTDPDVIDAIAVFKEVAQIIDQNKG